MQYCDHNVKNASSKKKKARKEKISIELHKHTQELQNG